MFIRRLVVTALVVLVVSSQVSGQATRSDTESVRRQLAAVMDKYIAALKAGDARAISQLFTADAVLAFNREARGPQVVAYWNENMATFVWDSATYTPEELTVAGDTAFESAIMNQTYRRKAGGEPVMQRLRSAVTWRLQGDGSWKIHRYVITIARLTGE